ncbi:hypothetical protein EIP91_006926, partial [Steccherinum ochraceum]
LLHHVTIASPHPLSLGFSMTPNTYATDPLRGFAFHRDSSLPDDYLSKFTFGDLPDEHKVLWKGVLRIWQMHCCRDKDVTLLWRLSINYLWTTFILSRVFQGESSDVESSMLHMDATIGPAWEMRLYTLDASLHAYLAWGFKNRPDFSTLLRVTVNVNFSVGPPDPVSCYLELVSFLFPRTYARGLISQVTVPQPFTPASR